MNKAVKASLLSALVFPGSGHFLLKKYIPGTVLAGTAFAGLGFLIAEAVEKAVQITEKIQSGEVRMDAATITELVSKRASGADAQLLDFAMAALLIAWLIGIVDSYRVGRAQDKNVNGGA